MSETPGETAPEVTRLQLLLLLQCACQVLELVKGIVEHNPESPVDPTLTGTNSNAG